MMIDHKDLPARRMLAILLVGVLVGAALMPACSRSKKEDTKDPYKPAFEWVQDMRERIHDSVEDPANAVSMIGLVDQIEQDLYSFDEYVQKFYRDLEALNSDYNTTREDVQKAIDDFTVERQALRKELIEMRFRLKDLATEKEWEKIADQKKTLYENWQKAAVGGKL